MTLLEMCLNHITLKYLEHCKRYGQVIAQLLGGYHMYAHTHIFSHEILENRKRTLFGLKITPRCHHRDVIIEVLHGERVV